ncbi:MAG: hypothetical protein ACKOZL_07025 [Actinomycetes bacterium]
MTTQLHLLDGGRIGRHLDARTRRIGRKGVARAREALARIQPPPTTGRQYPKAG